MVLGTVCCIRSPSGHPLLLGELILSACPLVRRVREDWVSRKGEDRTRSWSASVRLRRALSGLSSLPCLGKRLVWAKAGSISRSSSGPSPLATRGVPRRPKRQRQEQRLSAALGSPQSSRRETDERKMVRAE
jgi:hypothetical protein